MDYCLKMIRRPVVDPHRFQNVWQEQVLALRDEYEMKP
jgi:acyl-CoA dehydrogenase